MCVPVALYIKACYLVHSVHVDVCVCVLYMHLHVCYDMYLSVCGVYFVCVWGGYSICSKFSNSLCQAGSLDGSQLITKALTDNVYSIYV